MVYKLLILFQFMSFFGSEPAVKDDKIKAWIEIEGELDIVAIRAKIENTSHENVFLNYQLEMHTRSRIKDKKTLQRGKFMALGESIIALSESRMNAQTTDELCILIKVLKGNQLVAIDSVVFHAAK